MKKILALTPLLILCLVLVAPTSAAASTPNPSVQAGNTEDGIDPSSVTASTKLEVRKVASEPNRVYLFDAESEKTHVVVLSEKTKLTARRKKDFDGRRKLEFGDLEAGQTLKVTYRVADGQITSIQVVELAG